MVISRLILKNWKNFKEVDVDLQDQAYLVGPNASGKSNFLDALKFLRDISKPGGGLQKAVEDRGGISKIRCLAARAYPDVELEVHLSEYGSREVLWKYEIGIKQKPRGNREPILTYERVWKKDKKILDRPNDEDLRDEIKLTQTYLQQINVNTDFRDISMFFSSTLYLHLVPQLLKYPDAFTGREIQGDPFGKGFLERVAKVNEKTRKAWLKRIEKALQGAMPQLKELNYTTERGYPHLEALYEHWRPNAGKQREDQFSDGTLRLIGLLWSLQEGDSLLLLEEPELSLNNAIVSKLAPIIHDFSKNKKRQVIVTTHSSEFLSEKGIAGDEVLILKPDKEGTRIIVASKMKDVRSLLEAGMSVADAVVPLTKPTRIEQFEFFK